MAATSKYFSAPDYIYEGTVRFGASFSALSTTSSVYFSADAATSSIWVQEAQFSGLTTDHSPTISVGGKLRNSNVSEQYITFSSRTASQAHIAPSAGGAPTWRVIEVYDINNLTTLLNGKEPTIAAGTSATQVWKGNKSWGFVDYTEITNKPTTWAYTSIVSVPTATILGRNTAGTGAAEALTPSTARSVLGLTGWATKSYTDGSTSDVAEGTNLYYTDARVSTYIGTQKGAANGLVPLGADSKIASTYLPAIAITDTFVVASSAAMVGLSAETGDVAVRTDENKCYILKTNNPAVLANWQELLTPTAGVSSVNGQSGAVTLTTTNINEGTNLYYTDARVRAATLSGYSVGANTGFSAADTILQAFGKAQAQINSKENAITSGNSSYVWHGNKTFGPVLYSEISGAPSASSVKYSATFVGQSVWEITHNFATSATNTVCYVGDKQIDSTILIGSNTNSAVFAVAKTGYAVVFG